MYLLEGLTPMKMKLSCLHSDSSFGSRLPASWLHANYSSWMVKQSSSSTRRLRRKTADKAANWKHKTAWHNWSIAAKWLRTRHIERTKRAFPCEGLERRAALVKAVSSKPWEGWTSTGALPPTGCPCADCVNKDPPRANRFHLGSQSDQYVIQLHAQHQAEMEPSDVQTSASSSPQQASSSSGKGASALPAVQPLTPEEESDEDQTWGIWSCHGLPAPLAPEEESEDQTWGTWTGHGHS